MGTVLITGGSGFVGSNVAREILEEKGDRVVIYDLFPPRDPFLSEHMGKDLFYVNGNVLDMAKLLESVKNYEVDGIIHTAAPTDYRYVNSNPLISIWIGVGGTLNVLEVARAYDLKVVYISSGAVYGEVGSEECVKEEKPMNPKDMYGIMKAGGELLVGQYPLTYGLDCISLRLYFIYGPGMATLKPGEELLKPPVHPCKVVHFLLSNAVKGKSIKWGKGGDSALDYTYVKDSAHGIVLSYYGKPKHRLFNISTGRPYSLIDVANIINELVGKNLIEIGNGEIDGWPKRPKCLDNSRAKEELGYVPRYGMKNGLKEFFELMKLRP